MEWHQGSCNHVVTERPWKCIPDAYLPAYQPRLTCVCIVNILSKEAVISPLMRQVPARQTRDDRNISFSGRLEGGADKLSRGLFC